MSTQSSGQLNTMVEKLIRIESLRPKDESEKNSNIAPASSMFSRKLSKIDSEYEGISSSGSERTIIFNIRGECFTADANILEAIPDSRLALLAQEENLDPYLNKEGEVFYNKDPIMFSYIMKLYKEKVLHIPMGKCVVTVQEDLLFWGIDDSLISPCCRQPYCEALYNLSKTEVVKRELENLEDDIGSSMVNSPKRRNLALFLHKRNSSVAAKIWSYVFPVMLFVSVGLVFGTTHTNLREPLASTPSQSTDSKTQNKQLALILNTKTYTSVKILELLCCLFFTIELVLRIIAYSTNICRILSISTLCHLIYLIPAWITILVEFVDTEYWIGDYSASLKLSLHVMSMMRVFHLLRLALVCRDLMVLWLALKSSVREMTLMLVLVLTVCVVSSSLMFITNLFIDSSINSMLEGLWWTIITITTVGYGDQYPRSWPGYIVGSLCALTGVIITGMSIPPITNKFHEYYQTRLSDDLESKNKARLALRKLSKLP